MFIFNGRSNPVLGQKLAQVLDIDEGRHQNENFADGEIQVRIKEELIGSEAIILQSLGDPVGQNLLEMLLLADACRRRGARRVIAVIPYFGYARQDRRILGEEPIGARLLTDLIGTRFDQIVTCDLHNPAIEGFSTIPLLNQSAVPLLAEAFREHRSVENVLVAPDSGAVKLVQRYAELLHLPVAYVEKIRKSDTEVSVRAITGNVEGRAPVLVDDMISTGGTVVAAIEALLEAGARRDVTVIASHGLFVGKSLPQLAQWPIQRIITTDSLPAQKKEGPQVERYPLAELMADALRRAKKLLP